MAYTRGLVKLGRPIIDARSDDDSDDPPILGAYLPHSCDEWVIGGVSEIETLIEDLQTVLEHLKGRI